MSTTSPTTTDRSTGRSTGRWARTPLAAAAVALALSLVAVACADDDPGDGIASEPTTAGTASTVGDGTSTTVDGDTSTTVAGDSTTSTSATGDTTTSTTGGSTTTVLAGEPWDGFAKAGDVLSVFGVAADDTLNLRAGPGTDTEVLATLAPTADDLVATGNARQLSRSFWYEVTVDGVTGWVSVGFVAYEGATDDATAEYLDGGTPPSAETMVDLAELVSAGFASEDPPSELVQVVAPTVGDLGEITYDVVGLGDDAGAGYRLHLFANPLESGEGFELRTIERTSFCTRGVTGEFCN